MRLLPTARPHILDTLFPMLCEAGVPTGTAVAEITRLCLPCRFGAERRLEIRNRLISAMVDHAIANQITTLTGVVTASFLAQIMMMGWRCERLGQPVDHRGASLAAFRITVEADTPEHLAATGIYRAGTITVPLAQAA